MDVGLCLLVDLGILSRRARRRHTDGDDAYHADHVCGDDDYCDERIPRLDRLGRSGTMTRRRPSLQVSHCERIPSSRRTPQRSSLGVRV